MIRYTLPAAILILFAAFMLPAQQISYNKVFVREDVPAAADTVPIPATSTASSSGVDAMQSSDTASNVLDITAGVPLVFAAATSTGQQLRGIYVTGWVAGSPERMEKLLVRMNAAGINAVVVDVKDYSGYVSYKTGDEQIARLGAEKELRIGDIGRLMKQLKEHHMYAIARVTIFQDSVLAKSAPQWALKSKKSGGLWRDNKGLAWMDASSEDVWNYNLRIAKSALSVGFDEVNFDYVRFPSDGILSDISYPVWDGKGQKRAVMRKFFSYVRESLPGAKISADLFGLLTVRDDDMGIGQLLEDALPYFDAVCPMTYPSHYVSGFLGYKNPADYPYEILQYSLERALVRSKALADGGTKVGAIRPWLQAFDLGATYDSRMIGLQTKAYADVSRTAPGYFDGFLFWDPKNTYTSL